MPHAKTLQSKGIHSSVSPEGLRKLRKIRIEQAKEKLKRTTQKLIQLTVMLFSCRYRVYRMFQNNWLGGMWAYDTMDG